MSRLKLKGHRRRAFPLSATGSHTHTGPRRRLYPPPTRTKSDRTRIRQRFAKGWDAGREREAEGFEGSKEGLESRVPIYREQVRPYFFLMGP